MAIQFRRGNETDLVSEQLLPGEPAYAIDTKRLVIGDGEGDATLIPTDEEVRNQVDDIVNSRFASKMNLGTTLYHNPNGLQITAGMNIPLNDSTSKYTHLLFDMYAGEGTGTGKRPHITEASGEIVFTATNLVNAPSTSTYHAIFEAVLQVSTNSISVTSFRRVAVSSGSTYTPSYDENVTAASWTIYRIIGLQFYADVDGGPAETYLSQLIAQTQAARDSANTAAGEVRSEMAGIKAVDGIVKGDGAGNYDAAVAVDVPITDADGHFAADNVEGALAEAGEHIADTDNPHGVTAAQIGLGDVDNTADADKPVSTAQAVAIAGALDEAKSYTDSVAEDKADKSALTETNLRIATINKSLSDYQNAIASINVNQSPKQTASGYGTVSLPVNAANGQISVSVGGNTVTDENGTNSTVSAGRLVSANADETEKTYQYYPDVGLLRSLPNGVKDEISFNKQTGQWEHTQAVKEYALQASDIIFAADYVNTNGVFVAKPLDYIGRGVTGYINGNATISGMNEGSIEDDISSIGNFNSTSANAFFLRFTKGTYPTLAAAQTALAGTVLTYQLSEPIVTPVNVTGTLVGHPNGTIYWEPVLPVAGVYDDGIAVTSEDFPIDTLDRIVKIDFDTGLETTIDKSTAEIAADGLSFTHPDLSDGDIVFFTYYHAVSGTLPELDATYFDSRFVRQDSATGKFYKLDWGVENGDVIPILVEVE